MSINELTSREAVLEAMSEHDRLGRAEFLRKYGYGEAKSYFVEHEGRYYDSKAIAGVAVGKQFPEQGPMKNSEFSGGESIKRKLESLSFRFADGAHVTSRDIALLRSSRQKSKYADLSNEERGAYIRVTSALKAYGEALLYTLGAEDYRLALTSGFHLRSGVRGYVPKDLWFGIYATENAEPFVGNPQLFMIVSERGVEFGFSPATHPSGFSDSKIKAKMRAAAPEIFELMPGAESEQVETISNKLEASGGWHFRNQTRLDPNQDDRPDLPSWIRFLKSSEGARNAGGSISKYVLEPDLDHYDLMADAVGMAQIFGEFLDEVRASKTGSVNLGADETKTTFADAFAASLTEFEQARSGPYGRVEPLWSLISDTTNALQNLAPIGSRPHIKVSSSLGSGNWARVPWIGLLNRNVTTTTEKGLYCVFLIAADLSRVYLTLAQGVTELVNSLGPAEGAKELASRSSTYRQMIPELGAAGFTLTNDIDLASEGRLPTNYERSTIAFVEFARDQLPPDAQLSNLLEPLLAAYDRLAEEEAVEHVLEPDVETFEVENLLPYSIDDAMDGLFIEREEFQRILATWRLKKNLVLQGAPGVGKSYIAHRLAYALIGSKDRNRVEAVQFHQSYGYEDFVQGYRPDGSGGFARFDGSFFRFCIEAIEHPDKDFVFIIDEINRGNLSKIFGELMLLIESDKRSPDWGVQLSYAVEGEPRFHIPPNVFIIGMMNTADRSLSMVDYALRRRFAFITMDPLFESAGFRSHLQKFGIPLDLVGQVIQRMGTLNEAITDDRLSLGRGYQIGHSYFVPSSEISNPVDWFEQTVETEIRPLLEEYWFDEPDKAEQWVSSLLRGG
ncbi:DUF3578 domain-containing protein [Altererythrobacter sp. SALINAS58]|uniref:MrcB family domain-containing protein n=1 Tax=Alteripontixanthobacter muriae TaxID=2705546 RepID=UPI0015753E1E|nr:DUF3578 domain-containing protein [Alteripontixanthobacter muriae]NTZ43611.1 DUF3578 domain-containing protein [Alteripontixanthobacter muriae]